MSFCNKLECLSRRVLYLWVRLEPTRVKHLSGVRSWVSSWPNPRTLTRLERPARGKHSSLLIKLTNYGRKKFLQQWVQEGHIQSTSIPSL
jgi:hypothetical protein